MSDIELKPCPFCGVRPEYAHDYFNGRGDCMYAVACSDMECPMEAIADGNGTKEDAIRIWNTRAPLTLPEGYVLVPVKLPEPMLDVLWSAEADMRDADMQDLWDALIAARPEVK